MQHRTGWSGIEGRALLLDPHGKRRDIRIIDRAIIAAYQGVQLHRSFMASWGTNIKSAPLHFSTFSRPRQREDGMPFFRQWKIKIVSRERCSVLLDARITINARL